MGRKRKDIRVIRTQVLFCVRANKTLPAARVVHIMSMKNEYCGMRDKRKTTSPGEAASPHLLLQDLISAFPTDWIQWDSNTHQL